MIPGRTPQAGAASGNGRSVQVHADDAHPGSESGLDTARRLVHADAYARHRRANGDDVHFTLAVAGEAGEVDALRSRLEALAISCEWDRTVVSADPSTHRALQLLFLALLERDLLYGLDSQPWERGGSWFLRSSADAEWCADGLDDLGGTAKAAEAQRQALGRVEGIEIAAAALGLGDLTVFTPHADAVAQAKFVAISPRHPQIESIAPPPLLSALAESNAQPPAVQTELQAAVPGVEGLLPLVVTPVHEPLALASLGIPERDEAASSISARLPKGSGLLPLKTRDNRKPQPAVRYQLADLPVSEPTGSGPPVPVIRCKACGAVAVPSEQLPLEPAAGDGPVPCPSCGGDAVRDSEALAPAFQSMWSWLLTGPLGGEAELGLGSSEPAQPPLVISSSSGARLLQQRIATNLFQQLRAAADGGDLVEAAALVGSLQKPDPARDGAIPEPDELIASEGADVVRFALLDSAAVGTPTGLYASSLRHAKRFLDELRDFARPRLDGYEGQLPPSVDRGSRLRRRLVAWCAVASQKVTEAFAELETSRVTHNLALLLRRIEDFEERAAADGEVSAEDREAVVYALSVLLVLAAPCVPDLAAELVGEGDAGALAVSGAGSNLEAGGR